MRDTRKYANEDKGDIKPYHSERTIDREVRVPVLMASLK